MKCIVCDRCKKIIEDKRKCRVITCAKPFNPAMMDKRYYRGNSPKDNDIFWVKEICLDCLDELEVFFGAEAIPDNPPDIGGDEPGDDNTDPENPDTTADEQI